MGPLGFCQPAHLATSTTRTHAAARCDHFVLSRISTQLQNKATYIPATTPHLKRFAASLGGCCRCRSKMPSTWHLRPLNVSQLQPLQGLHVRRITPGVFRFVTWVLQGFCMALPQVKRELVLQRPHLCCTAQITFAAHAEHNDGIAQQLDGCYMHLLGCVGCAMLV